MSLKELHEPQRREGIGPDPWIGDVCDVGGGEPSVCHGQVQVSEVEGDPREGQVQSAQESGVPLRVLESLFCRRADALDDAAKACGIALLFIAAELILAFVGVAIQ